MTITQIIWDEWTDRIKSEPLNRVGVDAERRKALDKFISENYPKYSMETIAKICGVGTTTVRRRAKALGLT